MKNSKDIKRLLINKNSVLFYLLFCLVYSLSAQKYETPFYLIKHDNTKSIVDDVSLLKGVHLQSVDDFLTKKGFLLVRIENHERFSDILNNSALEYISPVYVLENSKVITHTNEIFIAFKKNTSASYKEQIEKKYGLKKDNQFSTLPDVNKYSLKMKSLEGFMDIVKQISAEPNVRYCQPNYMFTPTVAVNDPFFPRQWALENNGTAFQYGGTPGADMKVLQAWQITKGDPSIKVAILDSGVDTLHPDLVGNLLPGYDAKGEGTRGYPGMNYKSDAHGTACAGIVGAVADNGIGIVGVAPLCKIIPVRVFNYINFMGEIIPWSTSESMVNGITWAWQEGKADVLSNSWGITDQFLSMFPGQDSVVNQAIFLALANGRDGKGVPMLFSSGNDGGLPIWPSRLPEVIAVNATSMCDERKHPNSCDNENWEGNWGIGLDISAPGVKIAATDISGSFGYSQGDYTATFNGTSAACPNAAGVMALILSANPNLTGVQARFVIESTCDKVGGYDYNFQKTSGAWSPELGYGRVNAHRAVVEAQKIVEEALSFNFYVFYNDLSDKHVLVCHLEEDAEVVLEVFNIMGSRLALYPAQSLKKGSHQFYMNNFLKQGIYFARLSVNNNSSTIKFFAFN